MLDGGRLARNGVQVLASMRVGATMHVAVQNAPFPRMVKLALAHAGAGPVSAVVVPAEGPVVVACR